jgi:hypothetical protein
MTCILTPNLGKGAHPQKNGFSVFSFIAGLKNFNEQEELFKDGI